MTTKGDSKSGKSDNKSKLARPKDAVKDLESPKEHAKDVHGGKVALEYKPQKPDGS